MIITKYELLMSTDDAIARKVLRFSAVLMLTGRAFQIFGS